MCFQQQHKEYIKKLLNILKDITNRLYGDTMVCTEVAICVCCLMALHPGYYWILSTECPCKCYIAIQV